MRLLKLVFTLLLIALACWAAIWLKGHPGSLKLDFLGWRVETSFAMTAALAGVATILIALLVYGLVRLSYFPLRYRLSRQKLGQAKALDAITYAMTSLAVADHKGALQQAKKAEQLLGPHPLVDLVRAHVARTQDDHGEVSAQLEKMLAHDTTRMLAASALSSQARGEHRWTEALEHAETAYCMLPDHAPNVRRLFDLLLHRQRWSEAETLLKTARKQKTLGKDAWAHLAALLAYQQGLALAAAGEPLAAQASFEKAHRQDPAFIPGSLAYIAGLMAQDKVRPMLAGLARSWKARPHPALHEALLGYARGQPAKQREQWLETMLTDYRALPEADRARAELALSLNQPALAQSLAEAAFERAPDAATAQFLADLTAASGDSEAHILWQKRAAAAPRAAWRCERCEAESPHWAIHCPNCESFDSLEWTRHSRSISPAPESFVIPYAMPETGRS